VWIEGATTEIRCTLADSVAVRVTEWPAFSVPALLFRADARAALVEKENLEGH
jgi:hypothetical protein